jgi:hypothetical protein
MAKRTICPWFLKTFLRSKKSLIKAHFLLEKIDSYKSIHTKAGIDILYFLFSLTLFRAFLV